MSNRIRVLHFVTVLEIGGTEGQLLHLVDRMDSSRFDIRLACLRLAGSLLERVEKLGIPRCEYAVRHLYGLRTVKQQLRFARYIRSNGIDVVHALGFYPNVFAIPVARLAGVPVTVGSAREQATFWTPPQRLANRVALAMADCVVVNADTVRRGLTKAGIQPKEVKLIPNGVDIGRFARAHASGPLRSELGWPGDAPIVAVVSRLAAGKGIEFFLEAAAAVSRTRPDARFLIVGDGTTVVNGTMVHGDYRKELERRAAELGLGHRVAFTGYRLDVPELLAQVEVAVIPSLSEALSNALLESMASGAPVVATSVGDAPLVVEDGVSGILVLPADSQALARNILRLLQNPGLAAQIGDNARRVVRERYSLDRMVRDTETLYEDLVARARRRSPAPTRLAITP